jgi:hypothetical protein
MTREKDAQEDQPLGSPPGYGGVSEGNTGDQSPGAREGASNDGANTGSSPPATPLFKEELEPDEKGTSLDEGGAG